MRRFTGLIVGATAAVVAVAVPGSAAAAVPVHTIPSQTLAGTTVPVSSSYTSLQGGAVDDVGEYWYNVVRKDGGSGKADSINLVKTKTYSSTTVKQVQFKPRAGGLENLLGHANDMTWNSDTHRLLVPAWTNSGAPQEADQARAIRIINPDTLAIEKTVHVAHTTTGLCYDAVNNRYAGGVGGQLYVYDAAFTETAKSPALEQNGLSQGIDCDQQYVYIITSPKGSQKKNVITVYDWSFRQVAKYVTPSTSEGEHLTHQRGTFYLGLNVGAGKLYRLDGFQFTVKYDAGSGGTGSMSPTIVLYDTTTKTSRNTFTRPGYHFQGWQVSRSMDDKTRYRNPADSTQDGWYLPGQQPRGWTYYLYASGGSVATTTLRGAVYLSAKWVKD